MSERERDESPASGWRTSDTRAFPEHAFCRACAAPFTVGELVVERPPLSLRFYHADERDCS